MIFKMTRFDTENPEHIQYAKDFKNILFICPDTSAVLLGKLSYEDWDGVDHVEATVVCDTDDKFHYNYNPKSFNAFNLRFAIVEIDGE